MKANVGVRDRFLWNQQSLYTPSTFKASADRADDYRTLDPVSSNSGMAKFEIEKQGDRLADVGLLINNVQVGATGGTFVRLVSMFCLRKPQGSRRH